MLRLSEIVFTSAEAHDRESGLLGWVAATLNEGLRLDGLTVRRTMAGRLTLSFPSKRDGSGNQRFYLRPLDDDARRTIEQQVLASLGADLHQ